MLCQPQRSLETEDTRKALTFCIESIEKGTKTTTSVSVLLKLPDTDELTACMKSMDKGTGIKQFKACVHKVLPKDFIESFNTPYWGEVSGQATMKSTFTIVQ